MRTVLERAYGKLNLTLDVVGQRPDGYHDMRMIMQSVDLCDTVVLELDTLDEPICRCDGLTLPQGEKNLAMSAAERFFRTIGQWPEGYSITITKRIPVQGGMAGGSSDAAAVLRALQTAYDRPLSGKALRELAADIGSDVPYCVLGGTALAEGRGEILTPLPPMPRCSILLVQPSFSVSTPALFRELDRSQCRLHPNTKAALEALSSGDLPALCGCLQNSFQPILQEQFPVIGELCRAMQMQGAMGACLTGTGSVVFGIFSNDAAAIAASGKLRPLCKQLILAHPV